MGYLTDEEIPALADAARACGLTAGDARAALLEGVLADLPNSLSAGQSPGLCFLEDLRALDVAVPGADGRIPLLVWLRNAVSRLDRDGHRESQVFRAVARRLGVPDLPPPSVDQRPEPEAPETQVLAAPSDVSLARLPRTGPRLFGRGHELALLDACWAEQGMNIVTIVAMAGSGKSALVSTWLSRIERDDYRGAERVLGWSFSNEGARKGECSADVFIDWALRRLGDTAEGRGWEKGERLANLVRRQRMLIVLDGLEALQRAKGDDEDQPEGALQDDAMCAFLRELAAGNPGLCVITTQVVPTDLQTYGQEAAPISNLPDLPEGAGVEILRSFEVQGTDSELRAAAREQRYHALSLTLLGGYLKDACGGDIRRRNEVGRFVNGVRARHVMASYESWLGEGSALGVLRILSLFHDPADPGSLAALRAAPAIPGLTCKAGADAGAEPAPWSDAEWNRAVSRLRGLSLLASATPDDPDTLDTHPLLREYLGERLRSEHPAAWREGHLRLFAHLQSLAMPLPATIEEMTPLYTAVVHGCLAGRGEEALGVYALRVQRGMEYFNTRKLGAAGADISTLSVFFDPPWEKLDSTLPVPYRLLILEIVGFALFSLGRVEEARPPMEALVRMCEAEQCWSMASRAAGSLSQLHLVRGELSMAVQTAQRSCDWASRDMEPFSMVYAKTNLAYAFHHAGRPDDAGDAFAEAEAIRKKGIPADTILTTFPDLLYCDFLLESGRPAEARARAREALDMAIGHDWLDEIALHHLSLGRAHLQEAQIADPRDFTAAAEHLELAITGLRRSNPFPLPMGLLPRADLRRATGDLEGAANDIAVALAVARRNGAQLFRADAHLADAEQKLARGARSEAQTSLDVARTIIARTGYHRRSRDVADLDRRLSSPVPPERSSPASRTYLDFGIHFERVGARLRAWTTNAPAGSASVELAAPLPMEDLDAALTDMGVRGTRDARLSKHPSSPGRAAAEKLGDRLYRALFDGELGRCLRESLDVARTKEKGLRIGLHLDRVPELAPIPWEYLHTPDKRFLAMAAETPIVRFFDLEDEIWPIDCSAPLRVLVAVATPADLGRIDASDECARMSEALRALGAERVRIDLLQPATIEQLQWKLQGGPYHVFHFIGHGMRNAILLEGAEGRAEMLEGERLATRLQDHRSLRLVLLNACLGAQASPLELFGGVAQKLVQRGIPAVIAMQFAISDPSARSIASNFYKAVSTGFPIDAALAEARKALDGTDVEWGAPVLYTRAARAPELAKVPPSITAGDDVPPSERAPESSARQGVTLAPLYTVRQEVGPEQERGGEKDG